MHGGQLAVSRVRLGDNTSMQARVRGRKRETDIQTEGSNCITSFVAAEVGTPIKDHITLRRMRNGFDGAVPGAWLC